MTARGTGACAVALLLLAACRPSPRPPSRPATADSHPGASSDSLLAAGERVYLRGAFDTARSLWNEALARSRARGDTLAEARALTWLGLAAWRQGDYRAAREMGEAALVLKQRLAREAELFKSYNALGLLAWNEGHFAEATRRFGEASAAARASGDAKGIASASGNLALVQTELGEFDEARRGFDSMRVAGRALRDDRIEGNALTNLGMLAVRVGDPAAAIPLLDSARARYRAAGYATGEQNALGQLGTAWAALGRPHLALAALDSALELSRREGVRQDEASDLEAMAEVYRDAGDLRRAIELYGQAEPINRALGLTVEAGADLRSQAEIRAALGALDEALEAATRALSTHRAAESRFEALTDLVLLAELEARAGRPRESEARLGEARELATRLGVRRSRAQVALAEARIADRSVASERVVRALRDAAPDLAEGGYGIEQEALGLEARALARLGRLDSAAAVGRRAVAALERVRVGYGSAELKASYVSGKQEIYADLAEVLRRRGRTEEAFEVTDAARGRVLIEGLASTRRDSAFTGAIGRGLTRADELLRSIGSLAGQLREAEAELAEATDTAGAAKVRFLRDRLASTRREYEELAVRMQEVSAAEAKLTGAGTTPAAAILAHLAEDEALIEYQPAGDSLLLFIARRGRLRSVSVPLPRGGLAARVRLARELIAARGGSSARSLPVLRGLGELLIGPARRSGGLDRVRTLIVVPHGVLAYLPFAALVDSATGRYLVEDVALLMLPSASSLPALRSRGSLPLEQVGADVVAPEIARLPATRDEAETVRRALPRTTVRLGRQGTESSTRAALAAGNLLHLATHGELNAWNPMFSWIETAAGDRDDPTDDGRLEVHEILGLRIRSPLVFLSGCETGLGPAGGTGFAQGEDFATLARAFLYAGATNVIATLWRVDDRGAAVFADRFYRRLESDGPAGALAAAQRASLADPAFRGPYYWAGYTLAGDGKVGAAGGPKLPRPSPAPRPPL